MRTKAMVVLISLPAASVAKAAYAASAGTGTACAGRLRGCGMQPPSAARCACR